jgi:hypothetical protein
MPSSKQREKEMFMKPMFKNYRQYEDYVAEKFISYQCYDLQASHNDMIALDIL